MDAETWFTGQESVDAGLADRVMEGTKAKAEWNLSVYDKAPKVEDAGGRGVTPEPDTEADNEHEHRKHRLALLELTA
jgi:hypothetical protein